MEALYGEGRVSLTDLHSVYEALFLRALTSFEVFLEKLFFSIVSGKTRYPKSRVTLRVGPVSGNTLKEIIHQGDKYLKWVPFNNTEERAKMYLRGGRPFTELSNGDRSIIKMVTTIRNAIAHKGPHAMNEFKVKVVGSMALLPSEKRPAGFLRSQVSPHRKRFEVYVIELARIATVLC